MRQSYYCKGKYEVIDIIEAFNLNFCLGNAIKYILRAGVKTPDRLQDLEKAFDYIAHEIQKEKRYLCTVEDYIKHEIEKEKKHDNAIHNNK